MSNSYCPTCNRIGIFPDKTKMFHWHCPWMDCRYRGDMVNVFPEEVWEQDYRLAVKNGGTKNA